MLEIIDISVYQHPLKQEGDVLFANEPLSHLLEECQRLFFERGTLEEYPEAAVSERFGKLFETVSLQKTLAITVAQPAVSWEILLAQVKRYYPQLVWTKGTVIDGENKKFIFEFIPLVTTASGFPFSTSFQASLVQQGIEASQPDTLQAWVTDLKRILTEGELMEAEETEEPLLVVKNSHELAGTIDSASSTDSVAPETASTDLVASRLASENQVLAQRVEELSAEITKMKSQSLALSASTSQASFYAEELRRESEEKERMRQTNERLEQLVTHLERREQLATFDLVEQDINFHERSDDWYKKRTVDLAEYDLLYRKAKYLEHTWQVNQQLTVTTERMTMNESKLTYERERLNHLKSSAKDIELFVMMDECKMINDRVKIRQGFFWLKPHIRIMNGDYENLVEKANYFDIIHNENKFLEKIIEEHDQEAEDAYLDDEYYYYYYEDDSEE